MDVDKSMVSVSVVNLFTEIQCCDGPDFPFFILSPTDPKNKLQPLNAGPKFPSRAKELLFRNFGADPKGFSRDNACCRIPRRELENLKIWVSKEYSDPSYSVIDLNYRSELQMLLTRPYWKGIKPPLDEFEFATISFDFQRISWKDREHCNEKVDREYLLVFWSLWISEESVFRKLKGSPAFILMEDKNRQLFFPK